MENNICQSCSMPMEPEMRGTEKDGSPSNEYCTYCYQNGAFTSPGMTLEDMRNVVKTQMEKRNIAAGIIDQAVNVLPFLNRWRM